MKVATCALGGGAGLVIAAPAVRLVLDPAGKTTVTTPTDPIDLGPLDRFEIDAAPRKVEVIAPRIQDGWTSARDVVLGAAWIQRPKAGQVQALSAVCPHLGCAIGWSGDRFVCPCHDSAFAPDGARERGPSERDLDPLPVSVVDGHLRLTWIRYRIGGATREPA